MLAAAPEHPAPPPARQHQLPCELALGPHIPAMQASAGIVEKAIADEADMILAASLDRLEDLDVRVEQLRADVVIASESDAFSKKMQDLLEPSRPILFVIGADGRHVTRYALLLDQHTVENVSLSNLVDAVRAAARDRGKHGKKKDQAQRGA